MTEPVVTQHTITIRTGEDWTTVYWASCTCGWEQAPPVEDKRQASYMGNEHLKLSKLRPPYVTLE